MDDRVIIDIAPVYKVDFCIVNDTENIQQPEVEDIPLLLRDLFHSHDILELIEILGNEESISIPIHNTDVTLALGSERIELSTSQYTFYIKIEDMYRIYEEDHFLKKNFAKNKLIEIDLLKNDNMDESSDMIPEPKVHSVTTSCFQQTGTVGHCYMNIPPSEDPVTGDETVHPDLIDSSITDLHRFNGSVDRSEYFMEVELPMYNQGTANLPRHVNNQSTTPNTLQKPVAHQSTNEETTENRGEPQTFSSPPTQSKSSPVPRNTSTATATGFDYIQSPTPSTLQKPVAHQSTNEETTENRGEPQTFSSPPAQSTSSPVFRNTPTPTATATGFDFDNFLNQSPEPPSTILRHNINWKAKLQEALQGMGVRKVPSYESVLPENRGNAIPVFETTVSFTFGGSDYRYQSETRYKSKKEAEQNAAKVAFSAVFEHVHPNTPNPVTPPPNPVTTPPNPPPAAAAAGTVSNWKAKLQEHLQKSREHVPSYYSYNSVNGFGAEVRFKYDGRDRAFKSEDTYSKIKDAEMRVAEIAWQEIAQYGAGGSVRGSREKGLLRLAHDPQLSRSCL